jgi:signal transduction histidine kinase
VSQLRDADGKSFVQEQLKVAKGPGAGWVEFVFSNPAEKMIENKVMYLEKVDDVFLGVGYFVSRK